MAIPDGVTLTQYQADYRAQLPAYMSKLTARDLGVDAKDVSTVVAHDGESPCSSDMLVTMVMAFTDTPFCAQEASALKPAKLPRAQSMFWAVGKIRVVPARALASAGFG
jgi:hypothetical protein